MRKLGVAAAVLAALMLSACSNASGHGEVINKDYTPGYTTFILSGKVMVPMYNPPSWQMDVYENEDDHGWVSVDETTYHQYEIGDEFP